MLAPLLAVLLAASARAETVTDSRLFNDTVRDAFTQGVPVREALSLLEKALGRDPLKTHPNPARAEALVRETEAVQSWDPKPADRDCPAYALDLRKVAGRAMVPEPLVEQTVEFYWSLKGCLRYSKQSQAVSLQQANREAYAAHMARRLSLNFSVSNVDKNLFGPNRITEGLPGGVAAAGSAGPAGGSSSDPNLPRVQVDPRLTRQPGPVPTLFEQDVRRIKAVASNTIVDLNLKGQRFAGTSFAKAEAGNVSRMKLDCYHQAEIVIDKLHQAGIGNYGDDVWTTRTRSYEAEAKKVNANWFLRMRPPDLGLPFFNGQSIGENYYTNGHYWVEVKPKDPKQPTYHIDTWRGMYGVQQPGSDAVDWKPIPGADVKQKLVSGGAEG